MGSKGRKAVPTLGGGEEREGRCPVSARMGLVTQKLPQDKQVKRSLAWMLSECFGHDPFFEGGFQGHPVDKVPTYMSLQTAAEGHHYCQHQRGVPDLVHCVLSIKC